MKYFSIICITVLTIASASEAGIIKSFGVKTGIGITNLSYKTTFIGELEFDNRIGVDLGGFLVFYETPVVSSLIELRYFQKGMTYEIEGKDQYNQDTGMVKYDNRLDYLSISLFGQYTLRRSTLSPYLYFGPRIDFLIGYDSDGWDILFEEFKSPEFGADIGAGTEIKVGTLPVMLAEFRYNFYLDYAYKTDQIEMRNRSFEILVGVKLGRRDH